MEKGNGNVDYVHILEDLIRDSPQELEENPKLKDLLGPQYDNLMEVCHFISEHHIDPSGIIYRSDEEFYHFEFPNEKTEMNEIFCMNFPKKE